MRALITAYAFLLALLASCRPPPVAKPDHAISDNLHCFAVSSVGGAGLVCTERAAPCETIRKLTAEADGVEGVSECQPSHVMVDVTEP